MENIDKSWKGLYKISGIVWMAGALLFFIMASVLIGRLYSIGRKIP